MTDTPTGDFDDLLGTAPSTEEKTALTSLKDGGTPAETPEAARIRELEARLAEAEARTLKIEEPEKTAEQKTLEHSKALQQTTALLNSNDSFESADGADSILVHVLHDGFTAFGRVWYTGQEIEIPVGGQSYESTRDRFGHTWLDDISPAAQSKRWGKVYLGVGEWPFEPFTDSVAVEDSKRGKRAPVVKIQ